MGAEGTKTERESSTEETGKKERWGRREEEVGERGIPREREREREKKQERKRTNNGTVMNTESSAGRVNTGFQKGCMKLIK